MERQAGPVQQLAGKCGQKGEPFWPAMETSTLTNKTGYIEAWPRGVSITLMKPKPTPTEGS